MDYFDANGFNNLFRDDEKHKELQKSYSTFSKAFCQLKTQQIPEFVEVRFRFLPADPLRCPKGFLPVFRHEIEIGSENTDQRLDLECLEALGQECAVEKRLFILKDAKNHFRPNLKDAVERAVKRVMVVFPISVFAWPKSMGKDDVYKNTWVPSTEEHGALLEVRAEGLLKAIRSLRNMNPKLGDLQEGWYLKFKRRGNKVEIETDAQMPMQNPDLMKKYPEPRKWYHESKNFPIRTMTFAEQEAFLDNECWWGRDPEVVRAVEAHRSTYSAPEAPLAAAVAAPASTGSASADALFAGLGVAATAVAAAEQDEFGSLPWESL